MHLSSTGYFLFVSLIITCSRQSLSNASIKGIIARICKLCQGVENEFYNKIVATALFCDMILYEKLEVRI